MARQLFKDTKDYDTTEMKLRQLRSDYTHGMSTPVETFEALRRIGYSASRATIMVERWRIEDDAAWRQMTQYELENDTVIEHEEIVMAGTR